MSPVFGAVFLWLLATILWWSGWREEATEDIPHWAVGVFLSGWPMALLVNVRLTASLSLNGAWIWMLACIAIMAWRIPSIRRWTSVSAGILVGAVYILIYRLAYYPSGFTHFLAPWGAAMLVGWLAALLLRNVSEQVLAVSSGLYFSAGITVLVHGSSEPDALVHASEWMQGWWIAVLYARLWSVSVRTVLDQAKRWSFKMGGKRGGQRS